MFPLQQRLNHGVVMRSQKAVIAAPTRHSRKD